MLQCISIIIGIGMLLISYQVVINGWVPFGAYSGIYISFGNEKYLVGSVFSLFGLFAIYTSVKQLISK